MSEIQKFDEYKSQITRILTTMFDYLPCDVQELGLEHHSADHIGACGLLSDHRPRQ